MITAANPPSDTHLSEWAVTRRTKRQDTRSSRIGRNGGRSLPGLPRGLLIPVFLRIYLNGCPIRSVSAAVRLTLVSQGSPGAVCLSRGTEMDHAHTQTEGGQ